MTCLLLACVKEQTHDIRVYESYFVGLFCDAGLYQNLCIKKSRILKIQLLSNKVKSKVITRFKFLYFTHCKIKNLWNDWEAGLGQEMGQKCTIFKLEYS